MTMPKLAICIPTYNRATYLRDCLDSVFTASRGLEHEIEIVLSDNASTDGTRELVDELRQVYPAIEYYRNENNIGGERNFYRVVQLAHSDYVWVFGDDDMLNPDAIRQILEAIAAGYDLIISNFSIWSQDMTRWRQTGLKRKERGIFDYPDDVLSTWGIHLAYISSVIIKRSRFLSTSPTEYETVASTHFPQMYAVYAGLMPTCRALYLPEQLFRNRSDNAPANAEYPYGVFLTESSALFDALQQKGYSLSAIRAAKEGILRDYLFGDLLVKKRSGVPVRHLFRRLSLYYGRTPFFWLVCAPVVYSPRFVIIAVRAILKFLRRIVGEVIHGNT